MNPLLLKYYNDELVFFREMGAEFAKQHPKIASRLGMQGIEVQDPYVERLIEAFCFMSARMQLKLDAEFPTFTQHLLDIIYPNYTSPTPSMSVARFSPDATKGNIVQGSCVPRKTGLTAEKTVGESLACQFTTTRDVQIWPLEITQAKFVDTPPDLDLDYFNSYGKVQGALRLSFAITEENISVSQLKNLEKLPVYLIGEERISSQINELLHTSVMGICIKDNSNKCVFIDRFTLEDENISPDESLLPLGWNNTYGHTLLTAYFSHPSLFYFFSLNRLSQVLRSVSGSSFEVILLLSESPGELSVMVDETQFALFCTPIVNLFEKSADKIFINHKDIDFHIQADKANPTNYEVFSVRSVSTSSSSGNESITFRPLYHTVNEDEGNYGRYFTTYRVDRLPSETVRKYGTRTAYTGTEVFISLVDQYEAPLPLSQMSLHVDILATNRDLALLVPRNSVNDLKAKDSFPIKSVGIVRPISAPRAPLAEHNISWELIRLLSFNYLPLIKMPGRENGQILRDILKLFAPRNDKIMEKQIQALISADVTPVTKRLPGVGPIIYGRGTNIKLTVDEEGFSGISPYNFGLVIKEWLVRHVSMNSFVQVELFSLQRGLIHRWPVKYGNKGVV